MADKNKLSTDPYKGVRDFFPHDMWQQEYIFDTWSYAAETFGYERYDASVLEPTDLYKSKSGEEIINDQTYTFVDRGDREVTLRPEMTPSVARMVAAKSRELPFPLRWYSIPNLFRYERPQRGRLREHWQLNCDLFGIDDLAADVECILLSDHIMRSFGATHDQYSIRINHLGMLKEALTTLGVPDDKIIDARRLLDQKNKIENFNERLESECGFSYEKLEETLDTTESKKELDVAVAQLEELGIQNLIVDHAIVRGQDYYTGIVFEVFDVSPDNNRSMFGGGRYNNLTELFGVPPVPAVGFGMGDVTIRDFLLTHDLMPERPAKAHLFIATLSPAEILYAQGLAQKLRAQSLNVLVNVSHKKVGDQLSLANKQNIPFTVVIGENEVKDGSFTLKHMRDGTETGVTEHTIVEELTKQLGA